MAFVGTKNLIQLLTGSDVISPFDLTKIKNGSYELSLGGQVFQTGTTPRAVKNLAKKEKIYIDPGQFALLLTEEKVKIPDNKIAFISIKAGVKFNGLVNVSGFHVDPGFEGQLLFSVYNAGPSTIVLSQGTPYFPMWFAELNESQEYNGTHGGQNGIPDEPVKALSQGELASPNVLSKRIDEVKFLRTKIEWAMLVTIALLSALLVKVWTDSSKLKEAVEFGYSKKTEEILTDSTFNKMSKEFNALNFKVDSLMRVVQQKTEKKQRGNGKN